MKEMNTQDAELAYLIYTVREGMTDDYEALLDQLIDHLIEEGLDRDQIHLFLDTLLYTEQLPN